MLVDRANALKAALGDTLAGKHDGACLEARNLGLAERASIAYFLGVPFGAQCAWILEQGRADDARPAPAATRLVWEGSRPGERNERFRLYKK